MSFLPAFELSDEAQAYLAHLVLTGRCAEDRGRNRARYHNGGGAPKPPLFQNQSLAPLSFNPGAAGFDLASEPPTCPKHRGARIGAVAKNGRLGASDTLPLSGAFLRQCHR